MQEQTQQVNVQQSFNASKEALYKAWTEEGQLKQWWKPMDKQLDSVENDIREGGKVVYTFNNELKVHGEYKEVHQGEKLVYSWIWDLPEDNHHRGEYLLTIEFKGDESNSMLNVTQDNFKTEHSVKPHQEGWERSLEDLKTYLEQGNQ
jgi:uncharacterized protein YndB with AHSA1/START domain